MIKYGDIKNYEPCFVNKCIFATLNHGEKIKIKLASEDEELTFDRFLILVNLFKHKFNAIKNNFSLKKTRLLYVTEEGEKYTCKQICTIMDWNIANFQRSVSKNGEYKGIKFTIEKIVRENIKKERTKRLTYIRVSDNKKMTLKEISAIYKISSATAYETIKLYGEIKGVSFRFFRCGEEVKPLKTKRKVLKYKLESTGEIDTVSGFSKKYKLDLNSLRSSVAKRGYYKQYKFQKVEE